MDVRTPAVVAGLVAAGCIALAVLWWWGGPRIDQRARGAERSARVYRSGVAAGLGFTAIGLALLGLDYLGTVRRLASVSGRANGELSDSILATVGEAIPASALGGISLVAGLLTIVGSLIVVIGANLGPLSANE